MNVDKKRAAALFIILIMVLSGVASFMLLVFIIGGLKNGKI